MAGTRKGSGSRSSSGKQVTRTSTAQYSSGKTSRALSPAAEDTAQPSGTGGITSKPATRRRFSWKRALITVGIVLVVLIVGVLGYAYWQVQRTLPTTSGTIKFAGLSAPVTVTRDSYGVPHIVAANIKDLYAAQGYVHAQDRLFQMYLFRAVGEGRLSELLSPSLVSADKYYLTLGIRRAAEAEFAQTPNDVKDALQAYANGVNEFIHTHSDALPLEFSILGTKMEDWTPIDTLAFGKLQALDLTGDWTRELIDADVVAKVGVGEAAKLLPGYPAGAPIIVPGATGGYQKIMDAYNRDVRPWLPSMGLNELGSNNWVVDGTKSATGKPILANDPHLGVRNPSVWYQMHLSTSDGKYDVVGFTFASAPGIITGHNRNIAWGVTNTGGDVQDLFLEKLDPTNHPGEYQEGDKWLPLQLITETIKVKDSEPVTYTVRLTQRGPLLSNAFVGDTTNTLGSSVTSPFSMAWTALQPGHLFEAVYNLQTAANWTDFRAALAKWTVPGQNFVYADTAGNIGYQMTGLYPIRKKGDGSVPVPGYTGEYGWQGTVPFESLASTYNPPDHYVATANNKPFPDNSTLPIFGSWAPPYRIGRIVQMLKAKDKFSVDDIKAMQLDTHSLLAQKVAPLVAALQPADPKVLAAATQFKGWDGNLSTDSTVASIYEVMMGQVVSNTLSDDLGTDLFANYISTDGVNPFNVLDNLMSTPTDPIWDRQGTAATEKRDDILTTSLTEAVSNLTSAFGDNMQDWTWGKLHTITPSHPFGGQPVIGGMFNLQTVPIGGDNTTVSVSSYPLLQSFSAQSHQSYRMIEDLSNWSNSLAIYANGQSGQPFSKHFGDMQPLWSSGQYNPLLYSQSDVDAHKDTVLTLQP